MLFFSHIIASAFQVHLMELQVQDLHMEVFQLICSILEDMPLLIQDNTSLECRFAGSFLKTWCWGHPSKVNEYLNRYVSFVAWPNLTRPLSLTTTEGMPFEDDWYILAWHFFLHFFFLGCIAFRRFNWKSIINPGSDGHFEFLVPILICCVLYFCIQMVWWQSLWFGILYDSFG